MAHKLSLSTLALRLINDTHGVILDMFEQQLQIKNSMRFFSVVVVVVVVVLGLYLCYLFWHS